MVRSQHIRQLSQPISGEHGYHCHAATVELGVTEEELMDALGIAEGGMPQGGQPPAERP
jgi:hypothetical protein